MTNTKTTKRSFKVKIVAGFLSVIMLFSIFSAGAVTVSAAEVYSAPQTFAVTGASMMMSDATTKTAGEIVKTIACFVADKAGGAIVSTLVGKGVSYILGLAFEEEKEDKDPGIQDVLNELTNISGKIDSYHKEEMAYLKLINSNIDSKDFRMEADSIVDDYQGAFRKINQYSKNITTPGDGEIDQTTYRTYKSILADSSCNLSALEKNFNTMAAYVKGARSATDYRSGYRLTSEYLLNKVLANYKETDHDWIKSTDFSEVVNSVNGELETMQANAVMDFIAILALNNMSYKIREYEVNHGIYEVSDGEDPYAYYEKVADDMINAMASINEFHKTVQQENLDNHDFVQAVVTLSEPVGGKTVKGFHSFTEAWAQASATGKDFSVIGYQDVNAVKGNGYDLDNIDRTKYGFSINPSGHLVTKGKTVSVDLTGHTFDASAESGRVEAFQAEDNTCFTLKNANIKNGQFAIYVKERSHVSVALENVNIDGTSDTAILFRSPDSKDINLDLNNCTVKNTKNGSAVRVASKDKTCAINVNGCRFENNSGSDGGAISCPNNDMLRVNNTTFIGNKATGGYGGAINTFSGIVEGCTFKNNRSAFEGRDSTGYGNKGAGGAIAANFLICTDSEFTNNTTNDQAGAIIGWGSGIFRLERCTFTDNQAPNVGGAVRVFQFGKDANQEIRNCTFNNNKSRRGGGIFIEQSLNAMTHLLGDWNNNGTCYRSGYDGQLDRGWGAYACIEFN